MINLNPHSRLASFYRYFYLTTILPNNLCSYFWRLMFAFICFPFVWVSMAINRYNKVITRYSSVDIYYVSFPNKIDTMSGYVMTMLLIAIGCVFERFIAHFIGINIYSMSMYKVFISFYITGVLAVLLFIGLFLMIIKIFKLIDKRLSRNKESTKYKKDLEAFRQWVEDDKEKEKKRALRKANPNFIVLIWKWIVAFKEKNCPLISWDNNKEKK